MFALPRRILVPEIRNIGNVKKAKMFHPFLRLFPVGLMALYVNQLLTQGRDIVVEYLAKCLVEIVPH
jgi:hypothetical protein